MKLKNCFNRMKDFPDIFKLIPQQESDLLDYFTSTFNCKFIPNDFLVFISVIDGLKLNNLHIFSINDSNKPYSALTFKENSTKEITDVFFKNLNINTSSEFFLFATDCKGGRYAFKNTMEDNKVYYFPTHLEVKIIVYDNFSDLLEDVIEKEINMFI